MPDEDALERRLQAVERTLADGDHDLDALREAGEVHERVERLESTVADLRERVDDLDAATQALRGYVGNVRSVNRDVERRADAALAAVDRLEADGDAPAPSGATPTTETADRSGEVPPSDDRSGPTAPTESATPPDQGARTARAPERDPSGRPRECPYCSNRSRDDPGLTSDGRGRSDAPEATDGREAAGETDVTGRLRGTGESTPSVRTPASPPRREDPSETPATTRTDRDEGGTLDRIRDLLA